MIVIYILKGLSLFNFTATLIDPHPHYISALLYEFISQLQINKRAMWSKGSITWNTEYKILKES